MATTDTFAAAGTFTWLCPAGVTSVQVDAWGGGGGGRGGSTGIATGGAAGGAYAGGVVAVAPGSSYTVVVGAAGAGGAANLGLGTDGGDSSFKDVATILAKGGPRGPSDFGAIAAPVGSSVGTTKFAGGNGGDNSADVNGGGGGGSATNAATGGNGQTSAAGGAGGTGQGAGGHGGLQAGTQPGQPGVAPGGGGGGGAMANVVGGAGAAGKVTLTYTPSGGVIAAAAGLPTRFPQVHLGHVRHKGVL